MPDAHPMHTHTPAPFQTPHFIRAQQLVCQLHEMSTREKESTLILLILNIMLHNY